MNVKNFNPNQRTIKIEKAKTDMKNIYTKLNIDASNYALSKLSANGFKLWFYFAKNETNFEMLLFRVNVIEQCGMSENTYRSAFKELTEKGFLVQSKKDKNHYHFYEKSKKMKVNVVKIHKELSADLDDLAESIGDQGYIDTSEKYAPEVYEFEM